MKLGEVRHRLRRLEEQAPSEQVVEPVEPEPVEPEPVRHPSRFDAATAGELDDLRAALEADDTARVGLLLRRIEARRVLGFRGWRRMSAESVALAQEKFGYSAVPSHNAARVPFLNGYGSGFGSCLLDVTGRGDPCTCLAEALDESSGQRLAEARAYFAKQGRVAGVFAGPVELRARELHLGLEPAGSTKEE